MPKQASAPKKAAQSGNWFNVEDNSDLNTSNESYMSSSGDENEDSDDESFNESSYSRQSSIS